MTSILQRKQNCEVCNTVWVRWIWGIRFAFLLQDGNTDIFSFNILLVTKSTVTFALEQCHKYRFQFSITDR